MQTFTNCRLSDNLGTDNSQSVCSILRMSAFSMYPQQHGMRRALHLQRLIYREPLISCPEQCNNDQNINIFRNGRALGQRFGLKGWLYFGWSVLPTRLALLNPSSMQNGEDVYIRTSEIRHIFVLIWKHVCFVSCWTFHLKMNHVSSAIIL